MTAKPLSCLSSMTALLALSFFCDPSTCIDKKEDLLMYKHFKKYCFRDDSIIKDPDTCRELWSYMKN